MQTVYFATFIYFLCLSNCYTTPISISTTSTAPSITNYYQDFGACSCDLTPNLCDNYCCCDSFCQNQASAWTAAYQCLTTSPPVETICGQTSSMGFGSFKDLVCVYYSNRGTIGYFYNSPQTTSINQPTSTQFSSISTLDISTRITSTINSLSLGNTYTATNQYIKNTSSSSYLFLPFPGLGGVCVPGTVNITSTGTYTCQVTPTKQNCQSINSPYAGDISICLKGNCGSNSSSVVPKSQVSGSTTCTNVITEFKLNYVLGYSSGEYFMTTATTLIVTKNPTVPLNTPLTITVTITRSISNANTAMSGNPGYLQGNPITMSGGIFSVTNPTDNNCVNVANSVTNGKISVPFGVNAEFQCSSPNPCSSSYYIDSISQISLTLNKYASTSDTVTLGGTSSTNCAIETYTVNILYSYNGWQLDPQYYIAAAYLTTSTSPDTATPTSKYLRFNWLYVDPSSVSSPPQNSFYTYFSNLWTPLKQKFGIS